MGMIEMLLTLSINVNLETTQLSTFFLRIKKGSKKGSVTFRLVHFRLVTFRLVHFRLVHFRLNNISPK